MHSFIKILDSCCIIPPIFGGTISKLVELDKFLLKIVIVLRSLLHVVVITYAEVIPNYYSCITLCR
jgi:hypothetical protein